MSIIVSKHILVIDESMTHAEILRRISAYAKNGIEEKPQGEPWDIRAPNRLGLAQGSLEVIASEAEWLAKRLEREAAQASEEAA